MKKLTTYGNIVNGTLKIAKREQFFQSIAQAKDCKIKLTVETLYKKRSNEQNAYYWAVIVEFWQDIIHQEWGESKTPNQVHEFLKMNFNTSEVVNEQTGEVLYLPKSTTENSTVEMEEYHQRCRDKAFEMFNVMIPLPNEQMELKDFTQNEK